MYAGVVLLAALFTITGTAIIFGARGWQTGSALVRELGLAFMLGFAAMGVLASLALIVGAGLSTGVVLLLALALVVAGIAVGFRRSNAYPRSVALRMPMPQTFDDVLALIGAVVTLILVLLMYRAVRHQPLFAYDAWNVWIPKAKAIYFFNRINDTFFKSLPAPSYPLLVPAVDAMAFRLSHSTDPSVIAQLDWVILVGLIGAIASLIAPMARRPVTWLFIAFFVVLPQVSLRWFQLLADWTLDGFLAISGLLMIRWLRTREQWLVWIFPIPLAAVLVTKREGQLMALALVLGVAIAGYRDWKAVLPRLAGAAACSYVVSQLPWRIWWSSHQLPSDLGTLGHSESLGRALTAARVVADLMFSYGMWILAVPLALMACAATLLKRDADSRPVIAFLITLAVLFVGFTWVIWSDPTIPLDSNPASNPIPREVGATALLSLVFAPVLVSAALGPALERQTKHVLSIREALQLGAARLSTARPVRVLSVFIVAQWLLVGGLAATVRHTGWIYYQGGDQLWYYTTGWLLGHGHFPQPGVGYLWSILLAPIAAITGPDVANAYPAIIAVQFIFLLPVAIVTMYGIGARIGGRIFGYWVAALWLIVPLVGIKYTDAGYHQRFTETLLPQGFGLTAMGDFPSMVAAAVSGYFCLRAVEEERPLADRGFSAVAAGMAAAAAIGIKPSTALFLVGPGLALLVARRARVAALFVAGIAPGVIALAFVKWRGFGYLPLLHKADGGVTLAAGRALVPLAGIGLSRYIPFHGHVFLQQLDQVREHFWSVRLVEWLVLAGSLGLLVRSRRIAALIIGWFAAIVLVKTGSGRGDMEGGNLLRILMPAYPAFVVMLAALPFLVPGAARRLPRPELPRRTLPHRVRVTALVAALGLVALVPLGAYAAESPMVGPNPEAAIMEQPPIPLRVDLGLQGRARAGHAVLRWRSTHPAGGPVFYHVYRSISGTPPVQCAYQTGSSADRCQIYLTDLGVTRSASFVDPHPPQGRSSYYVGVAANWLDDVTQGDVYELSRPVSVTVH